MGQMKTRASMPQGTASVETLEDMETAKITKTTTAAPAEALLTLEETRGNITIRLLSQSYEVIRDIWYKSISTERPPQELSASTVLSLLAGTEEKSCVTFASRRNATEVKTALTLTGEVLTRAIIRAKRQAQTWAPTDADDPHPWYEALFTALQEAEVQMAAPRLRAWSRQHPISPNSAREAIRYRNDLEWENRLKYWESHDGRILEVAIIIAENVARAQARRLDPDVGASATAPDNAPRTGSASTPEIDEEESARKKDDPAATRSTEDMDGAPNNHEAGRNHDKGNLGNGAAIETEENKNKGDDKASPAHPAPSATTAAAKEARESEEDAVTSRAATPDQKKEVAKAKKHESSTPNTTQTAREDTSTMTARTDEKGELHTTAASTKNDGGEDATLTPVPRATKQAGKDTSREETATSADKPPMTAQKTVIADGASTLHADEHHDIQEDKADGVEPKDTPKNGIETTTAPASGPPAANADTDGAPAPDPISTTDRGSEASQPNESRPYTAKRKSPPPGTAPSAREDTPVTTGVAPWTHNNRFAQLATQSGDEDGDSNESEFHTSAEETTPNAGPVPQENQQPPVRGEALVEIGSALASIHDRVRIAGSRKRSPGKTTLADLQSLENILVRLSHEEEKMIPEHPTQGAEHSTTKALPRSSNLSIVGDPRLRELTALRLEAESLLHEGAALWIDLAQEEAPPQSTESRDTMEFTQDDTLRLDIAQHPEHVTYTRLRAILTRAEAGRDLYQAHALLQHAGKWLEERLRVIKQAAQAEGFITVPAARDRQRQAQQTTTLAEKWRVAHALAAETGDRTDDLDKDHTMNRRRIWELVKGKNNRHDRDPRTKQ
jgi:hypothetical protein